MDDIYDGQKSNHRKEHAGKEKLNKTKENINGYDSICLEKTDN